MTTLLDHELVSGDTATPFEFQVVDDSGVARNLTGWSIRYVARYSESSSAASALDKSTGAGTVEITDAADGQVSIPFEAEDTDDLEGRSLPHEVEGRSPSGSIETLVVGVTRIKRDRVA